MAVAINECDKSSNCKIVNLMLQGCSQRDTTPVGSAGRSHDGGEDIVTVRSSPGHEPGPGGGHDGGRIRGGEFGHGPLSPGGRSRPRHQHPCQRQHCSPCGCRGGPARYCTVTNSKSILEHIRIIFLFRLLLDYKANLNITNLYGLTPVDIALTFNRIPLIELFQNYKSSV